MFVLAGLCLAAGILPGVVIDALARPVAAMVGTHMPAQTTAEWLSIVPIAESRSSYNGLLVFVFITVSASLAAFFIHRFASHALRRGIAWGCGFADAVPAAQYTAVSFAQPIRRVFGGFAFSARETVEMPPPGATGPARLNVEIHVVVWETFYQPIAGAIE